MKTRAAVCSGLHEPWKAEEIEIDPPHAHEVRVTLSYAGMCHSDEHLRTGDITAPPELLEIVGVPSMFPCVGGHEGSGLVTEIGDAVERFAVGDHVAVSFIPSCGICFWCATGRQNLCDLGMYTLVGPMISDGTWRYHLGDTPLNRMAQLGTFAEEMVVHEASLVKIPESADLRAAALISCGISTGFGSAVERAKVAARRGRGGRRVPAASDRAPSRAPGSPGPGPSSPSTRWPSRPTAPGPSGPPTPPPRCKTPTCSCPS